MLYPTEMAIVVTSVQDTVMAARKHLVELGHKLVPPKSRGEMIVRSGQPYFEIAQIARETKADLIVLTMQTHRGIKRILVGGTAEQVVRHAPCPVLTVRTR
jgi:nucleotide-binding universal stress UspA family protein